MSLSTRVAPLIESKLSQFTPAECRIADYFLNQDGSFNSKDFSSREVAKELGVSEASLTRFAKKCDFRGFREFVYAFGLPSEVETSNLSDPVLSSYQELLNKTYYLVDVKKIDQIIQLLLDKDKVFIYGKGSSGMAAHEMKLRFMRIGLFCEVITDDDMMLMNEVQVNQNSLVIGITISGKTKVVIDTLNTARNQKAATVLLTANADDCFVESFDVVQLFAVKNNLEYGKMISPQFPILVILDILYLRYMNTDKANKNKIWQKTYNALQKNKSF